MMKWDAKKLIQGASKYELTTALLETSERAEKAEALLIQENAIAISNGDYAERLEVINAELYAENAHLRAAVEVTEKAHENCIDELIEMNELIGKYQAVLFCKECGGTGHDDLVENPCPTCGPLREQLREEGE